MKTFKRILKPIVKDMAPAERFSLRIQDGVEIYEREVVHTYRIDEHTDGPMAASRCPQLIIVESDQAENGLLAKTRSEVAGLHSFLNGIVAAR